MDTFDPKMVPKPHPPSRPGSNTTFLLSIILLLTHTTNLAEFPTMRPVIEQMGAGPDVVAPALTRARCKTNGAPPPAEGAKMHHHGQSHDFFVADADLADAASRAPMGTTPATYTPQVLRMRGALGRAQGLPPFPGRSLRYRWRLQRQPRTTTSKRLPAVASRSISGSSGPSVLKF